MITAPTLLLWGVRDVVLDQSQTHDLADWVPDLRIEYLRDAGHMVQQEQPELVSRLMLDFLRPQKRS